MIGGNARVLVGDAFIRAATADYDTFDPGITEANFETAFPDATTGYKDGSGEAEYTSAPSATYRAGDGNNVSPMTQMPGVLRLTGLTKTELKAFIDAHINEQVDVCIKNDCGGANGLGEGVIFRDVNIWGGHMFTRNGVVGYEVQWDKLYPAACSYQKIQEFDIVAV